MKSKSQNFLQVTNQGHTKANWVDKNGHVNISHYIALLDKSLETLCSFPGSINSVLKEDQSYVARNYYVKHHSELIHPTKWSFKAGICSLTNQKFESVHFLYIGQTRVAKFYIECVFFDLIYRKAINITLSQVTSYTHGIVAGFDQKIIE